MPKQPYRKSLCALCTISEPHFCQWGTGWTAMRPGMQARHSKQTIRVHQTELLRKLNFQCAPWLAICSLQIRHLLKLWKTIQLDVKENRQNFNEHTSFCCLSLFLKTLAGTFPKEAGMIPLLCPVSNSKKFWSWAVFSITKCFRVFMELPWDVAWLKIQNAGKCRSVAPAQQKLLWSPAESVPSTCNDSYWCQKHRVENNENQLLGAKKALKSTCNSGVET